MSIDMETMLSKIKDRQWPLADIDWEAPGVDDEFRPERQFGIRLADRDMVAQGADTPVSSSA